MKQHLAVRRMIDTLRRNTPLRQFITRQSELNLQHLAVMDPNRARPLLKGLLALERVAVPIEKLTVPGALGEVQNKAVLESMASLNVLFKAIDGQGRLDLRKPGIKLTLGHKDLTPNYKPETIEEYLKVLEQNHQELAMDEELGNLFLFKALLRARIDLYREGALRSARKSEGETVGMTQGIQRIKDFLDKVVADFPFGGTVERDTVKDGLEIASLMLSQKNNPAADATLASRTERLERTLSDQLLIKLRAARGTRRWKVKYQGKGVWLIRQSGYRRANTGFLRKQVVTNHVDTAKILSMVNHEIESISEEIEKNNLFLRQIKFLNKHYPAYWDKMLEIYLEFTKYQSLSKEKACIEIGGALELAAVSDRKGQAHRLAKSLLHLAQLDIERRQGELQAQRTRFESLVAETEAEAGRQLKGFAESVCADMAKLSISRDPKDLINVRRRLGGFLGTFFNDKMREPWLKRAKSRVVGVYKAIIDILPLVRRKQQTIAAVREVRRNFRQERTRIWESDRNNTQKRRDLSDLESRSYRVLSSHVREIGRLNTEIAEKVNAAAQHILLMNMDFQNRSETTIEKEAFLSANERVLSPVQALDADKVDILATSTIGSSTVVFGRLTRADARFLRFKNLREIRRST